MKYTVLGASGFVGRHLASALRDAGHQVITPARDAVTKLVEPLGHVIYCIGLTSDFRTRPFDTMRAHVSVLADVLERADFESLLYLSSTRVYGRSSTGTEETSLTVDVGDPSDLYNISKLAGESLCLSCARSDVRVARLSNVVGDAPDSDNFLFALIREALSGRIELKSDLGSAKDYILLKDVLAVLPQIAASGRDRIYNVGSGVNLRHEEITERLIALTSCSLSVSPRALRFKFPTIDVTRLRLEFDFRPSSVIDALPTLVATYASRRPRCPPQL